MGRLAANSWSLGEVALLFSMTRPTLAAKTVPFEGHAPAIVWVLFAVYLGTGLFSIWFEMRSMRRRWCAMESAIGWHALSLSEGRGRRVFTRDQSLAVFVGGEPKSPSTQERAMLC